MFVLRDELQALHEFDLPFEGFIEAFVVQHEHRLFMFPYDGRTYGIHHLIQRAVTSRQANDDIRFVTHPLLAFGHIVHLDEVIAVGG